MPGKITEEARFGGDNLVMKIWNWFSVYTARLFLPYAWLFTCLFGVTYSDLNLRNMDNTTGGLYMLINWFFLPFTWTQASINLVVTLPAWIVVIPWAIIAMVAK